MHQAQHPLTHVVAEILRRHPLSPGKLAVAWQAAVGSAMARASTVALSASGRPLRVDVTDAAWQREIERAAPLICRRLDALLGPGIVVGLDVRQVSASTSRAGHIRPSPESDQS